MTASSGPGWSLESRPPSWSTTWVSAAIFCSLPSSINRELHWEQSSQDCSILMWDASLAWHLNLLCFNTGLWKYGSAVIRLISLICQKKKFSTLPSYHLLLSEWHSHQSTTQAKHLGITFVLTFFFKLHPFYQQVQWVYHLKSQIWPLLSISIVNIPANPTINCALNSQSMWLLHYPFYNPSDHNA